MSKKTLYITAIIAIIIVLLALWAKSNNKKAEAPTFDSNKSGQIDTATSLNTTVDNINVDSGIDSDLNSIDADLKTL